MLNCIAVVKKRSLVNNNYDWCSTEFAFIATIKVRSYWHRGRWRIKNNMTVTRDETTARQWITWMGISNRNRNSRLACGAGWHTELEVTFPVLWPRNSHRGDSDMRRSINWMQAKSRRGAVRWELDRKRNRPPSGDGRFWATAVSDSALECTCEDRSRK